MVLLEVAYVPGNYKESCIRKLRILAGGAACSMTAGDLGKRGRMTQGGCNPRPPQEAAEVEREALWWKVILMLSTMFCRLCIIYI